MSASEANHLPMSYWQAAFEDHGPAVLAFLASRTRRREDAEDLLQETFVRAIRAASGLRDLSRVRPYLLTIAHNVMVNHYRRQRPALFSELSGGVREVEGTFEGKAETRPDATPTDAAARFADLERRLAGILATMPQNQRTAFELAILRQERYDDIARNTGWTPGQVRVNVFRARRRAIEQLRDYLPPAPADA